MSSSFWNWRSAVVLTAAGLVACGQPERIWPRFEALDAGGFMISMPAKPDLQHGTMVLGQDTVSTHIDILGDSGVFYVSAWFDIPAHLRPMATPALCDSVWPQIVRRIGGQSVSAPGPLAVVSNDERQGWFTISNGTLIGVVLRRREGRMVVLNAAAPEELMKPGQRENMIRFLGSVQSLP